MNCHQDSRSIFNKVVEVRIQLSSSFFQAFPLARTGPDLLSTAMPSHAALEMVIQEEEIVGYQRAVARLIRKLDRRLLPFLALIEIARFGFQVAIGLIRILLLYTETNFLMS